jgi:hypothetical protein
LKDVTSTSFGLLIAFLLPGLEASYALSLWSDSVAKVLNIFLTSSSNLGLFLLVLTGALTFGLVVAVFRWLVFELWICRRHKLRNSDFARLTIRGEPAEPSRELKLIAIQDDADLQALRVQEESHGKTFLLESRVHVQNVVTRIAAFA